MKTLFLAWQAAQHGTGGAQPSRAWYPIGRLEAIAEKSIYRFAYTRGAERARSEAGFDYLDAFPEPDRVYEANALFPLFQNRVLSPRRSDYSEYVQRLALDPRNADPLEFLAVSGGERQTDHLEVFPKIQPRRDGSFVCRFFLHGWRHVNAEAQARLLRLKAGEALRVAIELTQKSVTCATHCRLHHRAPKLEMCRLNWRLLSNNPATGAAVQLQTGDDYFMIGWTPRYLIGDFLNAMAESPQQVSARLVQVNPEPAPTNQRALIELKGIMPSGIEPMSSENYQPIVSH